MLQFLICMQNLSVYLQRRHLFLCQPSFYTQWRYRSVQFMSRVKFDMTLVGSCVENVDLHGFKNIYTA